MKGHLLLVDGEAILTPHFPIIAAAVFAISSAAAASCITDDTVEGARAREQRSNHDLSLPDWGPYTKNYMGISHIPDVSAGVRFDLSVFPSVYRGRAFVPDVMFDTGFRPWRASPSLEFFEFRHDIEWKDQVFADIAYAELDPCMRAISVAISNNTALEQSVSLHLAASIHFPSVRPYEPNTPIRSASATVPLGAVWTDAIDYTELTFAVPRPQDNLVYDGWFRGEIREHGFVNGGGIGQGFGNNAGDRLRYTVDIPAPMQDAAMVLRYRTASSDPATIHVRDMFDRTVSLPASSELRTVTLPIGAVEAGPASITMTSGADVAVDIDGFAIVSEADVDALEFPVSDWDPVPEISPGPVVNSLVLKYPDTDTYYGIRWYYPDWHLREILNSTLTGFFEPYANNHTATEIVGDRLGHYTNVHLRPLNLSPHSQLTLHGVVVAGNAMSVRERLASVATDPDALAVPIRQASQSVPSLTSTMAGEPYRFSVQRLAATLLTNIVYPVYTQGHYIRHSAPGRWWDSLYTWDSGFIGLGLLELDRARSLETLSAYLTEPESDSAFIHHGTPLPVQHYLYYELFNRLESRDNVTRLYPNLKRYYRFFSGRDGSTTDRYGSRLLQTWDYFYNSGGWDDLPPQQYVHENNLTGQVTPVVTTAHAIRVAKILRTIALSLELIDDVELYTSDIELFSSALHEHAWDADAGYFGYVVHDSAGNPTDILRLPNGENLNKTLDGVSPLVAGVTTADQNRTLLRHLRDGDKLFSSVGITAVDQSASYYSDNGYWNGTVWMPHQWFIWKSLLDIGEHRFAHEIATTALDTWKKEVEASYRTPEHFIIRTGRGAGWHHFGALSSPILSWFTAYFVPGRLSVGLDTSIESTDIADDYSSLRATLRILENDAAEFSTAIVVLDETRRYRATWNRSELEVNQYTPGTLSVQIPRSVSHGELMIFER